MRIVKCTLVGVSPLGFSKPYEAEKKSKELSGDYEERTWRERMHADKDGNVYINPMGLKNALCWTAKWLNEQIPGQGKKTYAKRFDSGVMVMDELYVGAKKDKVEGTRLFVPSDGIKGSGKRVHKIFPTINQWSTNATIYIMDDLIGDDVFKRHIIEAGKFCGLGFWRPERGGLWGRFTVENIMIEKQ